MNFENDPIPAFDFGITHAKILSKFMKQLINSKKSKRFPKRSLPKLSSFHDYQERDTNRYYHE